MNQTFNRLSTSRPADYLRYQWYRANFKMHKKEIRQLSATIDSLSDMISNDDRLENALSKVEDSRNMDSFWRRLKHVFNLLEGRIRMRSEFMPQRNRKNIIFLNRFKKIEEFHQTLAENSTQALEITRDIHAQLNEIPGEDALPPEIEQGFLQSSNNSLHEANETRQDLKRINSEIQSTIENRKLLQQLITEIDKLKDKLGFNSGIKERKNQRESASQEQVMEEIRTAYHSNPKTKKHLHDAGVKLNKPDDPKNL